MRVCLYEMGSMPMMMKVYTWERVRVCMRWGVCLCLWWWSQYIHESGMGIWYWCDLGIYRCWYWPYQGEMVIAYTWEWCDLGMIWEVNILVSSYLDGHSIYMRVVWPRWREHMACMGNILGYGGWWYMRMVWDGGVCLWVILILTIPMVWALT